MNIFLTLSFFVFFFAGTAVLIKDLFPAPSIASRAAILSYNKKPKSSLLTSLAEPLALKLERFIRISKYRRIKLNNVLQASRMELTPEQYIAQAAAPAILFAAYTVPVSFLVFKPAAIAFAVISVRRYLKASNKAQVTTKKKREEIAMELPHFASTISEELKKGRNITAMLTSYSKVCGPSFQRELEITLADMSSGNHREALGRLNSRVGSLGLSQICRGLQSVLDGNDQTVHFQVISEMLENELDQQTERYIQSLYNKIKPYSMLLLGCMVITILCAMGIYLTKNMY